MADMRRIKDAKPDTFIAEIGHEKTGSGRKLWKRAKKILAVLVVVAAVAVLIAVLVLPILRIYGTSMKGTLDGGDLVVAVKGAKCQTGDIVAFYYNNNILVKRVIGSGGDWVDVDEHGNVYVNREKIDEPYLREKSYGENTDIDLPYQVPEDKVFVLGDNRSKSIDSRNSQIGCVDADQVVGKIVFRVWPLNKMGPVK